jgi:hypothetical protein
MIKDIIFVKVLLAAGLGANQSKTLDKACEFRYGGVR